MHQKQNYVARKPESKQKFDYNFITYACTIGDKSSQP